jgi:molecular chaperone GrpE (heat shock protein)
MKKIIINFSILTFIIIPAFVRAQTMVPVFDLNVAGQLEKIYRNLDILLVTLGESFKQTNNVLSKILETQFQQIASNVVVDLVKAYQYINNLAEIESFIEERRGKVKNQKIYSEALEEAKTAGAYLALQDFANTLSCLNPRIRNELTDYLKDINREFDLSLKAEELLNNIPDCPTEKTETVTLKPSFFSWLTQPFKLNLAQITQPSPEEEIPSISITPAFQKTEDSIELSDLKNLSASMIRNKARKQEEKRRKEIGEIWPVEVCSKEIVDKNISGGKSVCLEYSILISGNDMKRFKQELSLNNPLNNQAQSIDIFQSINSYGLNQLGITTSSISASSVLFNDLSTSTVKEKINKYCASYNLGPTEKGESGKDDKDKVQTAYIQCVNEFIKQYEQAIELLQKDVENRKDKTEKNQKDVENLIGEAQKIKESIDPSVCPGAYEDLEEITQSLETKEEFYMSARAKIANINIQLTRLRNLINETRSEINSLLDKAFTSLWDILPFLNVGIKQFISDIINKLLSQLSSLLTGIKIPLPILDEIKIGPLKQEKNLLLRQLISIVDNFNKVLNPIAEIIVTYNNSYYELYSSGLTNSSFLNDINDFNLIRQKLDAYERAVLKRECSYKSSSSGISLIKNQVIVVESKKEQKKSFNLFSSLKNLFSPKIVEIRNEK